MIILAYLLAAYGLGFFLSHKITLIDGKFKLLDGALECAYCMGIWSGIALYPALPIDHFRYFPIMILASGTFSYALDVVIQKLES